MPLCFLFPAAAILLWLVSFCLLWWISSWELILHILFLPLSMVKCTSSASFSSSSAADLFFAGTRDLHQWRPDPPGCCHSSLFWQLWVWWVSLVSFLLFEVRCSVLVLSPVRSLSSKNFCPCLTRSMPDISRASTTLAHSSLSGIHEGCSSSVCCVGWSLCVFAPFIDRLVDHIVAAPDEASAFVAGCYCPSQWYDLIPQVNKAQQSYQFLLLLSRWCG